MSLPSDILLTRLKNELTGCSRYLARGVDVPPFRNGGFHVEVHISLTDVPALTVEGDKLVRRYQHNFKMIIGPNYPFEKPTVIWQTPVFHPNIMMPVDGGHLCTKLLEDWSFQSTIISFIKGVEMLLMNPNPANPFGTDSCTAAAEFFNSKEGKLPPTVCSQRPKGVRIL
jgi:ubiquitin-protein ligase